jgi:glycosyltransferase involved in cell wall biosynthesis
VKILALSNFYPPHHVSGYAMLCADVVEALGKRGHEIAVLTSTLGGDGERVEGHVHRLLTLESPLDYYQPVRGLLYPAANRRNLQHLRRVVADTRPDVIFVWGMWNLSKRLAQVAEALAGPRVVYYLANPWPIEPNQHRAYWSLPTRRARLNWLKAGCRQIARAVLHAEWRDVPLRFDHAPCCSGALRDQLLKAGVPLRDAPTIYEGIDVDAYMAHGARRTAPDDGGILSLVYVGLLVPHKGVHTAIDALSRLPEGARDRVRLTVLGSGHPDYERELRDLVTVKALGDHVNFVDPIPRKDLPGFLSRHHVLLLPSIWEEPLALIMQEALASGLVVVGSATGGTREIVRDGDNGLLFDAEDAGRLAEHIARLVADAPLRQRLSSRGQETAKALFDLRRMVDDIEAYLAALRARPEPV